MNRLFLLDGMALIYRAHFAFAQNPIRNSQGINTSAIFGFTNTLLTILEKERPSHIGVAFDTSAPTARHIEYPAYKAQREAMPDELRAAIPEVKRLCAACGIPVIELDGYEADDIIGTLAKNADETGNFSTFMVTPDKDFAQLVSPKSTIWRPGRKGAEFELLGLSEICENWQIERPEQVIDILGLWGDASDNIPGVPGIGEKTAKSLISRYGSIEGILSNLNDLKGKQKENLTNFADQARLSRRLATIDCAVPLDVSWDSLELSPFDDTILRELFNQWEFRTLAKRVFERHVTTASKPATNDSGEIEAATEAAISPEISALATLATTPHEYLIASTPALQNQLFRELSEQKSFCFDLETTGLNRFQSRILGIAFSWQAHRAWFLPFEDALLPDLKACLSSESEKIGHNLKFDLSQLANVGIEVNGPIFDTLIIDGLLFPERRHGMDDLAEKLLNYQTVKLKDIAQGTENPETGKISRELDMESISPEALAEYAAEDADITYQLAEILRPLLADSGMQPLYENCEAPLIPVLMRMEREGIRIDDSALSDISLALQSRLDELESRIQSFTPEPFNLGSPKQLGEVLFNQLNLAEKAKKTKTGQFKTDEQTLRSLEKAHPIIPDILAWREASKLKSTYVDALPTHIEPSTQRIHTNYSQWFVTSGRLAASDPNLQNIPIRSEMGREIRRAFVARNPENFTLLSCDYSQIELRVMAALSGDESMIAAFQKGIDIHTATAAKVFHVAENEVIPEMRRTAKMVNFGIIYGISAFGLSQRLSIPVKEADAIIRSYFREYPAIQEAMDRTIRNGRELGYVRTLGGRRRSMPDLLSHNQTVRTNAERASINLPIQGTAAEMIKLAMIRIDNLLRKGKYQTRMLLQVHDELIFDLANHEADELTPRLLHAMQHALPLPNSVPTLVESGTGNNWLEAH